MVVSGVYSFHPAKLGFAHEECFVTVKAHMELGYICIVHNTFTRESEVEPYVLLARENGYKVVSLVVENRHGNHNVHGVSDEKLEQQADRFSLRLTPAGRRGVGRLIKDNS